MQPTAKITSIDLVEIIQCDTERVKSLLKTCKDLLEHYRGNSPVTICRLCKIAQNIRAGCFNCPWMWFTGKTCIKYQIKHFPDVRTISRMRNNLVEPWTSHRIEQLDEWIPEMEHYLKLKGDQKNAS